MPKQETRRPRTSDQPPRPRPEAVYDFRCPVQDHCGGCQLSEMPYQEQLQLKQKRVRELLGGFAPIDPIRSMEKPYHYRNKVHAVLGTDKRGLPVSGVYAYGTHRLIPVKRCLLEDSRADAIIRDIVAMLPRYKLRIYNEYTHRGYLRHIMVRTGRVSGQIMVVLVATGREFPGREQFTRELLTAHP